MPTRRSFVESASLRGVLILALALSFGCAGRAWKQTTAEDTPASYYRFMREHGDSKYVDAARERLEFHKLKRNPSLAGFEHFRTQYPQSELIEALHPVLEQPAFEAARARGTAEAYRAFLDSFGQGALAARAEGNAIYVEAQGFGGDAMALGAFAEAHPESDFAAEAERTARAARAREAAPIERVGLVVEVGSTTPERRRVRQVLVERIEELAQQAGLEVVPIPAMLDAATAARYPQARLEVTHEERTVESEVSAGGIERSSRLGVTEVVLRERPDGPIISERRFELRVADKAHVPNTSVLFSAAAPKYWSELFVPTARWRNDQAIRPSIELDAPIVDVAAVGDRAVVLYENGNFDVLGLADPTRPVKLGSYRRGEELERWSGVRLIGSRVVIFGEEGLELVRFSEAGAVAEQTWNRGQIGRVLSIAELGHQIVLAGAKGMQLIDPETGEIRRILRRVVQGVATAGEALVFVDGESVYVSTLELLAEERVIAQMKLGRTFAPNQVRVLEQVAIVTGPGGALVIDVRNPQAPRALAKLASLQIGEIFDATRVRGRTFLVGARGALLLNRELHRVEETIDVGPRNRVAVMGRHLVFADGRSVQVVDAAPWADQAMPAAQNPSMDASSLMNGSGF